MKPLFVLLVLGVFCLPLSNPVDAKIPRSYAAKAEFKRSNPCPSNGHRSGPCPGYQIDHTTPLKCGGDDSPRNMQWLTVDEHQAKTRREARWCVRTRHAN